MVKPIQICHFIEWYPIYMIFLTIFLDNNALPSWKFNQEPNRADYNELAIIWWKCKRLNRSFFEVSLPRKNPNGKNGKTVGISMNPWNRSSGRRKDLYVEVSLPQKKLQSILLKCVSQYRLPKLTFVLFPLSNFVDYTNWNILSV